MEGDSGVFYGWLNVLMIVPWSACRIIFAPPAPRALAESRDTLTNTTASRSIHGRCLTRAADERYARTDATFALAFDNERDRNEDDSP